MTEKCTHGQRPAELLDDLYCLSPQDICFLKQNGAFDPWMLEVGAAFWRDWRSLATIDGVQILIALAPAAFFRFEVPARDLMVETDSGSLTEYWPLLRRVLSGETPHPSLHVRRT